MFPNITHAKARASGKMVLSIGACLQQVAGDRQAGRHHTQRTDRLNGLGAQRTGRWLVGWGPMAIDTECDEGRMGGRNLAANISASCEHKNNAARLWATLP
jgi:hypothetical protein